MLLAFEGEARVTAWSGGMALLTGISEEAVLGQSATGEFLRAAFPVFSMSRWGELVRLTLCGEGVASEETGPLPGSAADGLRSLEIEHRRALEKRIQTSKMQALGERAGGIAHEIHHPLAIISGYVGEIADSAELECRPVTLSQVLLNLINNTCDALDAIAKGIIEMHCGTLSLEEPPKGFATAFCINLPKEQRNGL